jgi:RHS repeat-associated protein
MPIASTGTTANNYLYSGERFDSNLNLYDLRARFYKMLTGRFETMDPAAGKITDPRTLHTYFYAANNPVNASDPSGRDILEYLSQIGRTARTVIEGTRIGESALCYLKFVSTVSNLAFIGLNTGVPINQNIAWAYEDLGVCLELATVY